MKPPGNWRSRLVVGASWLTLFIIVVSVGLAMDLTAEDAALYVRQAGPWGSVGFLAAFVIFQPLGISSHSFCAAAALIWEWWVAAGLGLVGSVISATIVFFIGRYVAYEWVQERLPDRLRRYESWLVDKGVVGIVGFRMFTYTLHPAMLMIGTVRVRVAPMMVGTIIGFVPNVLFGVLLGGEIARLLLLGSS